MEKIYGSVQICAYHWQNDIDASDGKTDTLRADLQSHENYSQPALSFVIDNLKTKDKINCGFI